MHFFIPFFYFLMLVLGRFIREEGKLVMVRRLVFTQTDALFLFDLELFLLTLTHQRDVKV